MKKVHTRLGVSILTIMAVFSPSLKAEEAALPNSMGALGDSITASAFAAYPRQDSRNFINQITLITNGLAALVGRAIRDDRFYGIEARHLSWATGMDDNNTVISHARRLTYLNPKMKLYNFAISGGTTQTIDEKEVTQLQEWSRKNLKQEYPDYVAVLIGANDICSNYDKGEVMTEENVFAERMHRIVGDILEKNKNAKVVISAIPNIASLRDVAKDAPALQYEGLETCQKVWERFPMCKNLQLSDFREKEAARVEAFNTILKDLAREKNTEYDADRVRVSESIYRYNFTANDLALDCFHPNKYAHSLLADLTFEDTWWAGQWNAVKDRAMKKFDDDKRAEDLRRRRLLNPKIP